MSYGLICNWRNVNRKQLSRLGHASRVHRKNVFAVLLLGVAVISLTRVLIVAASTDSSLTPSSQVIPENYFGMHMHSAHGKTPWPSVTFGSWRLWDAAVNWAKLEPNKGDWRWEILDRDVELARQHNVDLLLTLGRTPRWASARPNEPQDSRYGNPGERAEPRDLQDWRDYVRTVATRYKGRIHEYEIWNEPNARNFYTGTPSAMADLAREAYAILKQVDSSNVVLSPSPSGTIGSNWLAEYLQAGGGKYADIIGYHFYVRDSPPEEMVQRISTVKGILAKNGLGDRPLWDTEAGRIPPLPSDEGPAFVSRAYILNWAGGVQRFYWYAWDNEGMGVRLTEDGIPTQAARAYAETEKWLVGARMESCANNSGTWVCKLEREPGYTGWIVWQAGRDSSWEIPKGWGVSQITELSGARHELPSSGKIEIGPTPMLLEARTR